MGISSSACPNWNLSSFHLLWPHLGSPLGMALSPLAPHLLPSPVPHLPHPLITQLSTFYLEKKQLVKSNPHLSIPPTTTLGKSFHDLSLPTERYQR